MANHSRLLSRGAAVIASLLLSSLPADAARPPAGRAIDRLPEIRATVASAQEATNSAADSGDRRNGTRTRLAQWWNQWSNCWRNFDRRPPRRTTCAAGPGCSSCRARRSATSPAATATCRIAATAPGWRRRRSTPPCAGWRRSGLAAPELAVVWHAGEPLTLPVDWYRDALAAAAAARPAGPILRHCIQTNGTLVDDRWCALFREHGMQIGVSLDGPARLHDAQRRTRAGRGTHDAVMRGVAALQRHGIPFHAICVIGDAALDAPEELVEFFAAHDILEIGFNVEEVEGVHTRSSSVPRPRRRLPRLLRAGLAPGGGARRRHPRGPHHPRRAAGTARRRLARQRPEHAVRHRHRQP